jgi:hypothetical protein
MPSSLPEHIPDLDRTKVLQSFDLTAYRRHFLLNHRLEVGDGSLREQRIQSLSAFSVQFGHRLREKSVWGVETIVKSGFFQEKTVLAVHSLITTDV